MRGVLRWLSVLGVCILAACESGPPAPEPTLLSLPSDTPTATESLPTGTPTPSFTATPTATLFFGHDVPANGENATLRVIHAAPDAGSLDFYLNDLSLVGGLGYGRGSAQIAVLPGSYVLSAAAPNGDLDAPLVSLDVTLTAGKSADVAVTSMGDSLALQWVEAVSQTLELGKAAVRVLNALTDDTAVSVSLGDALEDVLVAPGDATSVKVIDAGEVGAAFTADGANVLSDDLRVRELTSTLFVLAGSSDHSQLLTFETALPGRYQLRVINISEETREVDVYLNDSLLVSGLGYRGATERLTYASGDYRLSVYAAGADFSTSAPHLTGQMLFAKPGTMVSLVLYGPTADLRAAWIEEDISPVPLGRARVTFVHTLADVPGIRVGVNSTDLEGTRAIPYGAWSDPVLFDEGEMRIFIRDERETTRILELHEAVPIPAGQNLLYFVTATDDLPALYGQPVAVDDTLSPQTGEAIRADYRVRVVNAVATPMQIDIYHDDTLMVPRLDFGTSGPRNPLVGDSFQLMARLGANGPVLVDIRLSMDAPGDYSVFIHGNPVDGINATIIRDRGLHAESGAPRVRLINLSSSVNARYSLGFLPQRAPLPTLGIGTPQPSATPTPEPTAEVVGPVADIGRSRAPSTVFRAIADVGPRQASGQYSGLTDAEILILDNENGIVARLPGVVLANGVHSDVVVYEYNTETTTEALVIAVDYPPQSD